MAGSRESEVVAVCSVLLVLPLVFVLLRIRSRKLKGLGILREDWFLIAALLFNTANCVTLIVGATAGILGSHEEIGSRGLPVVTRGHIVSFQAQYVSQVVGLVTEGLTKVSLLLLYRRIFDTAIFRRFNDAVLVVVVLWFFSLLFATIFQCWPINTYWLSPVSFATPGRCLDFQAFYLADAITDFATDFMILALPIAPVLRLRLPLTRRIGICLIFLLGTFVLATGAVRIQEFAATNSQSGSSAGSLDLSYVVTSAYEWFAVQTAVGVICACLPTFVPLFDSTIKGSIAYYVPKSLSFSSMTSRSQSVAPPLVTRLGKSNEGAAAQRRSMHPWAHASLGESIWQSEEVSLEEARRSILNPPLEGIMVKQDVHVSVASACMY